MKTRLTIAAVAGWLGLTVAHRLFAQQPPMPTEVGASQLALVNAPARDSAKLTVTSPSFTAGGDIPFENTQYQGNVFPGLAWSAGPPGTRSYVAIMQDPDALAHGAPILHWTMIDIPASVTSLDVAMETPPAGARNGPNMRGSSHAYLGPRTPPGPKHRYHFQLFALDRLIPESSSTTYDDLIAAMKGHVLASGELVGLAQAPPGTPPRTDSEASRKP
jgi:para-nitrobenzyl esterase